jgi:D-serine dehydratase
VSPDNPVLAAVPAAVGRADPVVWVNPNRRPAAQALADCDVSGAEIAAAQALWTRAAPLLAVLFPELRASAGCIGSELLPLPAALGPALGLRPPGRALVKADHALPVTGCIKARGGVFEVLWFAFEVARSQGFSDASAARLAQPPWPQRFSHHTIVVGSTGNLGFSVGLAARALGFQAEVHMSADAKAWKKDRLRRLGVRVVEHGGDYGAAVAAARTVAAATRGAHFVDDESSRHLFVGYATAAAELARQLHAAGVAVDAAHPLRVYLPCGVGGAPGGVTTGLKHTFGDAVHCVFVEPVQSPAMLVQLACGLARPVSVYEAGLTNRTLADGLACATASQFSARVVAPLVEAVVTVQDHPMLRWVDAAWRVAGLRLEPSAAAAFEACACVERQASLPPAHTHVLWTTGGALLPDAVFEGLLAGA